ncbi:MAG: hypothetical protein F6K26_56610 [Moorea sp. SIO2I5]|nr:hypothetical protein [Moorena sp. SIO2I5]
MGRWGDGEMGKIFIGFPILTRCIKFSYPYSLLPTGAPSLYFILSYSELGHIHFQGGYYLSRN